MTASEVGKLKDSCEPARSTATATSSYSGRQQLPQRGLRGEGDRDRFRGGGGRGGVGGRFGGGEGGGRQSRVFGLGRGGRGGRDSGRGGRGLGRSFTPRPPGSGDVTPLPVAHIYTPFAAILPHPCDLCHCQYYHTFSVLWPNHLV